MEKKINPENEMLSLLSAGAALGSMNTEHDGIPYVVLPDGFSVHDLERLLPNPARKRANVSMRDTDSFIAYTNKHGSLDTCTVYADIDTLANQARYIAVIDDNGANVDDARWRSHTCTFTPAASVEWQRWTSKDKKMMSQAEFAGWLEDNLQDIASSDGMPSGTDMLQMALNFERNAEKRYKQKIDLHGGGVQFEFVDDEDKDTRTKMKVFERFALGIRVFLNGDAYMMQARLKYRERDGKLTFWFELIRHDKVFEAASNDIVKTVREKTGMQVLIGNPNL